MLGENYKQAVKAFETKVFLDIMIDHQATQAASTTMKNLQTKPFLIKSEKENNAENQGLHG